MTATSVARFADALLAADLPRLPQDRRGETVAFVERRVGSLPSVTRFGVRVIGAGVDMLTRLAGAQRTIRVVTALPVPLLAEYPRLVRSLGYAFVWETWPTTETDGAPTTERRS